MLLKLQKPPAPAAPREQTSPVHKAARGQAVTCLAQLAPSHQAGKTQGESSHRSQSPISSGDWGSPPSNRSSTQNFSLNKKKKKNVSPFSPFVPEHGNGRCILYLGRDVDPGRLLLRSGVVGHALGGDPPYQRVRRLQPPYAARLVVARRCSVCRKLLAPARSVPAAAR